MMRTSLDGARAWIEGVRRVVSPNFDQRPTPGDISLLIVHGISLPPGCFGDGQIDQLFCNQLDPAQHPYFAEICELRVSSHLLIDRQGVMTQYVPFTERAWHAGLSAFQGRERCNDYSIGVELEGTDDTLYSDAQYRQLAAVSRSLMTAWPGITPERIVGHSDVAPGRKTDPGPLFDWSRFRRELRTGAVA